MPVYTIDEIECSVAQLSETGSKDHSFKGLLGSFQGIKWLEHETHHKTSCSVALRTEWSYLYCFCLHGMDRESFYRAAVLPSYI
jgi:hypothetical protein